MLNFTSNQPDDVIDFYPELAIYKVDATEQPCNFIHVRFASGCDLNINRNMRIDIGSMQSMELELAEMEKFVCTPSEPTKKFISCKSILKITNFDGTTVNHELGQHNIAVLGTYKKIKNSKGKKVQELTWPSFNEAAEEIKNIIQSEFSDALDEYLGVDTKRQNSNNSKVSNSTFFSGSIFSKVLNFLLIAVVAYTVVALGMNYFKGKNNIQTQNTVLETLSPEALKQQAALSDQQEIEKSSDEIALEEFGLEPGLNLDQ